MKHRNPGAAWIIGLLRLKGEDDIADKIERNIEPPEEAAEEKDEGRPTGRNKWP